MKNLVSVVVPVYKVEKYLHRCVDSILDQTYKNLEIILVDDGSPDNCGAMCDAYASKDTRVVVIHKKNGGLSDARNVGIEHATGEFITFVDSDDWIHETFVSTLVDLLETRNADIAVCSFTRTSEYITSSPPKQIEIHEFTNIEALAHYYGRFASELIVAWGKIYRRKLFKDIWYPVGKLHEDAFTTHKLIHSSEKIVLTTAPLIFYFFRTDSIMGSGFSIEKRLAMIESLDGLSHFFRELGLFECADSADLDLFYNSYNIDAHLDKYPDKARVSAAKQMRADLWPRLRAARAKYNFTFRCLYELYYSVPAIFNVILAVYLFLKNPLNRRPVRRPAMSQNSADHA